MVNPQVTVTGLLERMRQVGSAHEAQLRAARERAERLHLERPTNPVETPNRPTGSER